MATITVDTYKLVTKLKVRGFSEDQAAGVAEVIQDIDLEHMATKSDLNELRVASKADLAELKADLFKWIVPLLLGQAALIAALVKML